MLILHPGAGIIPWHWYCALVLVLLHGVGITPWCWYCALVLVLLHGVGITPWCWYCTLVLVLHPESGITPWVLVLHPGCWYYTLVLTFFPGPMPSLKNTVVLCWPDHTYLLEGCDEEDQRWTFVYHSLNNLRDTHMMTSAHGQECKVFVCVCVCVCVCVVLCVCGVCVCLWCCVCTAVTSHLGDVLCTHFNWVSAPDLTEKLKGKIICKSDKCV